MEIGSFVKVNGISLRGKNRVNEHGSIWKILKTWGTHLLVESTDGKDYWKWINGTSDPDFEITREVFLPNGEVE